MKLDFGKKIGKTGKYWKFRLGRGREAQMSIGKMHKKIPKNSLKLTKMGENVKFSPKIVIF